MNLKSLPLLPSSTLPPVAPALRHKAPPTSSGSSSESSSSSDSSSSDSDSSSEEEEEEETITPMLEKVRAGRCLGKKESRPSDVPDSLE